MASSGGHPLFWRRCAPIFRRAGGGGGNPPGCKSVRNVWPKTETVLPEGMAPGDDDRPRAPREPPARPLPGLRTGIGAVQPGVAAALRTIAPPHGFDLASAKAPRLGAGAGRAAANFADLGRRVTDANSAVVDAILALPAKLDPLRAAALTALRRPIAPAPCLRWPAKSIACSPPRRTGRQPKAVCRKTPVAPKASLPDLLVAYAAVRQRRRGRILEIAQSGRPRHEPTARGPAEREAF